MINELQLAKLQAEIDAGKQDRFYGWACWLKLAAQVKAMDHYECQQCKAAGHYSPGEVVHHVKHLADRPDLALSIFDPETGERQLVTLCRDCHTKKHPEHLRYSNSARKLLTAERWD